MRLISSVDLLKFVHPNPVSRICLLLLDARREEKKRTGRCEIPCFPGEARGVAWPRERPRTLWLERREIAGYLGPLRQANRGLLMDVYYATARYGSMYEDNKDGGKRILRTEKNVLSLSCLYADFDSPTQASEQFVRGKEWEGIPAPQLVVSTSEGRWQTIWLLDTPLSTLCAKPLLRRLCEATGGDPAVKDTSRVLRLPGYRNQKRGGWEVEARLFKEARLSPEVMDRALPPLCNGEHADAKAGRWVTDVSVKTISTKRVGLSKVGSSPGAIARREARKRWDMTFERRKDKEAADWAVAHYFRVLGVSQLQAWGWLVENRNGRHAEHLEETVLRAWSESVFDFE